MTVDEILVHLDFVIAEAAVAEAKAKDTMPTLVKDKKRNRKREKSVHDIQGILRKTGQFRVCHEWFRGLVGVATLLLNGTLGHGKPIEKTWSRRYSSDIT